MLLIQLYLVLIYLVDTLVTKKSGMGKRKIFKRFRLPFQLSTGSPTLDSDCQNVHVNLTYADLFLSKHPLTISQVNDLVTTNDR